LAKCLNVSINFSKSYNSIEKILESENVFEIISTLWAILVSVVGRILDTFKNKFCHEDCWLLRTDDLEVYISIIRVTIGELGTT
jgi:hypothetical protein